MTSATATPNVVRTMLSSTIGLKVLMAVTGLVWVGFVLAHMVGNLQIYLPMPADNVHPINQYAAMLKSTGGLLWVARLGLLFAFVAHIWAALQLSARNAAARPSDYRDKRYRKASFTSRYMKVSGFAILFFVLYHLAHFTLGVVAPDEYARHLPNGMHDVYSMFILGFRHPVVAALYVVANALVALHLHHAVSSIFQTLGLRTKRYAGIIDTIGPAVATVVAVGNISMPIAVALGLIGSSVH